MAAYKSELTRSRGLTQLLRDARYGPDFPQMEPTDELDTPNRGLPESRVKRFAKAARDHRTGLKLTISARFLLGAWLPLAAE